MDWLASCPTRHVCMVVHGCAAYTTYHDRGAHEGAEMCVLSASGGTVLRAGTRISRLSLTFESIQTLSKPKSSNSAPAKRKNLLRTHIESVLATG